MKKYLQIDCRNINLQQQNDEIVIRIKATVRADLYSQHQRQIELTNDQALIEKQNLFTQMFKSQIVYPPPPPPPIQPQHVQQSQPNPPEQQLPRRVDSIFETSSHNTQPQTFQANSRNIFSNSGGASRNQFQTRPGSSSNIFGRNQQREQAPTNNSNWRNNSIFASSSSGGSMGSNTFGPSIRPSNMFMTGFSGSGPQQPSLFSNQPRNQSSNNSRRNKSTANRRIA